jgi:hypothetical protein
MNLSRPVSKLTASALALAAACIFTAVSAQAAPQEGKAEVRAVRGTATYTEPGGNQAIPLKVGAVLKQGSTIKTGANSQVDLFLGVNGPVLRVDASSELGLDKLTFENTGIETVVETQLNLKAGNIIGKVKPLAAASRYEVKTANGVAGIRGTAFNIFANGVIHVVEGSIVVVYINPITLQASEPVTVNAGQTFVPPPNPAAAGARPTVNVMPDAEAGILVAEINQTTQQVTGDGTLLVTFTPTQDPRTGTRTTTVEVAPTETIVDSGLDATKRKLSDDEPQ